ncbi:MAG: hypothetical protein GY694_16685 [Gammaproteobacteria bacterium]|nr:hypothetical protein [Gammaproteobacteria bacterium]
MIFNLWSWIRAIAEFETKIRKERQLEGIEKAKAKAKGVKFGCKAKLTDNQISELKVKCSEGVLIKDLMAEYKISKASIYRFLD